MIHPEGTALLLFSALLSILYSGSCHCLYSGKLPNVTHQYGLDQGLAKDINDNFALVLQNIWWTLCPFLGHPFFLLPSTFKEKQIPQSILLHHSLWHATKSSVPSYISYCLLLKVFILYLFEVKETIPALLFIFNPSAPLLSFMTFAFLTTPLYPLNLHLIFFPNNKPSNLRFSVLYHADTSFLALITFYISLFKRITSYLYSYCIYIYSKMLTSFFVRQQLIFVNTFPLDNNPFIFLDFASLISSHVSLGVQRFLCDHLQHKFNGGSCTVLPLFTCTLTLCQPLPQNPSEAHSLSCFFPYIILWHFHLQTNVQLLKLDDSSLRIIWSKLIV